MDAADELVAALKDQMIRFPRDLSTEEVLGRIVAKAVPCNGSLQGLYCDKQKDQPGQQQVIR